MKKMMLMALCLMASSAFAGQSDIGASKDGRAVVKREMIGGAEIITMEKGQPNILDLQITSSYDLRTSVQRLETRDGYIITLQHNIAQGVKLFQDRNFVVGGLPPYELMNELWTLGSAVQKGCSVSMKLQVEPF